MDDDSSLCQGCGAMLPLPDLSGLVTCPSCGRQKRVKPPTLGAPESADPMDPGALPAPPPLGDGGWPTPPATGGGWPAPPVLAPSPGGATDWTIPPGGGPNFSGGGVSAGGGGTGRTVKVSGMKAIGCGCLPGLVVLIILGAIGFVIFRASDSVRDAVDDAFAADSDLYPVSGTVTVLGSGDGGTVDLVGLVQDNGSGSSRSVTRFSLSDSGPKVRWQGPTTPGDVYDVEIAQVGATIFAGLGDELWALDANTGARRWSATLSDTVTNGCADCFAAVDGTLVVRTSDAEVAGYREASAEPLWSRRLESPAGSVAIAGETLIVTDDPVEPDAGGISAVDPADGKVLRTFKPSCKAADDFGFDLVLGAGSTVHAVPGSTDVVGWASFGDGCVARWDPATGTTRFATRLTEVSVIDDETALVSGRDLVFSSYSDEVVHVSLETGKAQRLTLPPDTSVTPTRVVGRTLVAATATTRGTTKGGLAAWDLDSGEARWNIRLPGGAQAVSTGPFGSSDTLFDGSPRSLLVPLGDELRLFTFDGTDREVVVQSLDVDSGDLADVSQTKLRSRYESGGTISLTIEAVTPTRVVFSAQSLLQSLASDGTGGITTFPEID